MNNQKYYLGLDMGTSSVGWAVTDDDYNILRSKGKDMWGVRLFDEAKTSQERRTHRVSRRRRQREIARDNVLKDLFAVEIDKIDPGFYARLKESKYHLDDRSETNQQKYGIFADKNYTDKEYYEEFPTVFHLRAELLQEDSERLKDIRLVYLAIANLFSRRGHFLNDSLDSEAEDSNFADLYIRFAERASDLGFNFDSAADAKELELKLGEA